MSSTLHIHLSSVFGLGTMGYFDEGEKLGRSVCVWGVIFILGGFFDAGLALYMLIWGSYYNFLWIITGIVVFVLAISCFVSGGVGVAAGTKKKVRLAQVFFFAVITMLILNIASVIAIFSTSFVSVWSAYWMIFNIIMICVISFQGYRYWRYLKNGGSTKPTNTVVVVTNQQPVTTTTTTTVVQPPPQQMYVPPQPMYGQEPPAGQPMYVPPQQPMYAAPPPGQPMYQPPPGQPMYQPPPDQHGQPSYYAPPPQQQAPTY